MLIFKCKIRFTILVFLCITGCSFKKVKSPFSVNPQGYIVSFKNDSVSKKCARILYSLLSERTPDKDRVLWNTQRKDYIKIEVAISPSLEYDYCIRNSHKKLLLKIKDQKNCEWLFYQLVKVLSTTDCRLMADDLPPAIIDFTTGCKKFDFLYRDPYFLPNLKDENHKMLGTHTVENDWGIWGHNLRKVLKNDKEVSLYAHQSGTVSYQQFCFSSKELFDQTKGYILDNFGNGKENTKHFMIMPEDNNIVCDCNKCLEAGNTPRNSSPAISAFIEKLASCFPDHVFFTSAYATTFFPPESKWPDNTGVIISTMDLPKGIDLNGRGETKDFINLIHQWKKCVPTVYLWDYAANFDDYLTPIPILYALKKQFAFYKSHGVDGIFVNASGYDYTPFEEVKTFVTAALLMDLHYSVDSLCNLCFSYYYPESGGILSEYYLSMEKKAERSATPYHLYGGFEDNRSYYPEMTTFVTFYHRVDSLLKVVQGEEKTRLTRLYTALSFNRLQLAYSQKEKLYGFADKVNGSLIFKNELIPVYDQLSTFSQLEDLMNYREADGNLSFYLQNWERIRKYPIKNLLLEAEINPISGLDENGQDIRMLIDGVEGFDRDYHMGWYIHSEDDLFLQIHSPELHKAKTISMRFLLNEHHHMYLPEKVEFYKNNVFYKTIKPVSKKNSGSPYSIGYAESEVNLSGTETLQIRIYHTQAEKSSIACDEILLY